MILDRDECALNISGCSNGCQNTIGSFYCTCPAGTILDADQRTCNSNLKFCILIKINELYFKNNNYKFKECPSNRYGLNCTNYCNCINSITCNPASGCVCLSGYTGKYCETDINECKSK